jgi:hypothetical protein
VATTDVYAHDDAQEVNPDDPLTLPSAVPEKFGGPARGSSACRPRAAGLRYTTHDPSREPRGEGAMSDDRRSENEPRGLGAAIAAGVAVVAGFLRLVPHPWNMTPVGALGLFCGGRLRSWQAFAVPLFVMVASDLALKIPLAQQGFPTVNWVTPFVYVSFLVNVLIGRWLRDTRSPVRIGAASLLASVQFFLVTNFAVWAMGDGITYPKIAAGLAACFAAGVPFFGGTVAGDLVYSFLLFGLHAAALRVAGGRVRRDEALPISQ